MRRATHIVGPQESSRLRVKLHPIAQQLLDEIDAYLELTHIDRTTFGKEAVNDGHFIRRMEQGRIPKIPTIDKVRSYMAWKTRNKRLI